MCGHTARKETQLFSVIGWFTIDVCCPETRAQTYPICLQLCSYYAHCGDYTAYRKNLLFSANHFQHLVCINIKWDTLYILGFKNKEDCKLTIYHLFLAIGSLKYSSECDMVTWITAHFKPTSQMLWIMLGSIIKIHLNMCSWTISPMKVNICLKQAMCYICKNMVLYEKGCNAHYQHSYPQSMNGGLWPHAIWPSQGCDRRDPSWFDFSWFSRTALDEVVN